MTLKERKQETSETIVPLVSEIKYILSFGDYIAILASCTRAIALQSLHRVLVPLHCKPCTVY